MSDLRPNNSQLVGKLDSREVLILSGLSQLSLFPLLDLSVDNFSFGILLI